ncbi:MAG: hypothetical protein US89_C0016G0016 [Candidatus Peregrinibacteria bacterium GW2011_GWF2_38_29]|nr:MAG: hypothetical protein US89_C0016G0016 [Candidatus Peregrinibacteria bacterium GW2011_GWF2_38_29]HBB03129.1 hypothetical protein [Candidatus Peregrinibacteria bacterium]
MKITKEQSMFMPARLVFEEAPGEAAVQAVDVAAEAEAAAPAEGDKNPADKAAQEAAIRAKAAKDLKEAQAGVKPSEQPVTEKTGDKQAEAAAQKPAEQPAQTPAVAPAPAPAQTPAPAVAGSKETVVPPTAAETEQRAKFDNSFIGNLVKTFGGSTPEEQKKAADEAFMGKGFLGALAVVLGYSAVSPMVDKLADKSPKAKGFLDRIKGWFSGLMDGGAEKLSGAAFDDMAKSLKAFDKEVELDGAAKIPDGKRLVVTKDGNDNNPASIELPKDASNIIASCDGKEITLKGGESYEAKGADIVLIAGVTFPGGTKFSKGCKFEDVEVPKAA